MQEDAVEFNKRFRISLLIYLALISSIFLYAGMGAWVLNQNPSVREGPVQDFSFLRNGLLVLSVVQLPLSLWLKQLLVSRMQTAAAPYQSLLIITVAGGALAEAVGLYGLVLILATRHFPDIYPFLILSIVVFFFNFPRQEEWKRWKAN